MPSHSDLWALLTIISFDQISVMGYKSSGNHYHADDNENLKKTLIHWNCSVIIGQLFPYKVTPAWIHHFTVYRLLFRHVHATLYLGAGLVNHFDLPSPYPTIVPFMITPWSKTQLEPSSVKEERKTKVVYRKDDTTTSIFFRIVSDNLSFEPQADYCNIEGRKKFLKEVALRFSHSG